MGVYDSGEFSCPVCHDNYTLVHPSDCDDNLLIDDDEYVYRRYTIKIKYAHQGVSIKHLWFCHYLENYEDFVSYFAVPHPSDFEEHGSDKINVTEKNLLQIKN